MEVRLILGPNAEKTREKAFDVLIDILRDLDLEEEKNEQAS
ncbi:hypothetical protein [Bacillus badius]|uniref:Uncharacterized protein n=1 Tax=Bacillus badius TaxID=1455 RepID=A0ABR5ATU1_BACBA|nr:hypothetical protein [Bacillus badius]KIL78045.1 hypothetical protein SD77_1024 [Bacillus badius]MED4718610.1 hypothetical protein [Bacillus badius]